MAGSDDPTIDAAFTDYSAAVDALDAALADDVAHEVDAVVTELLQVAEDWQQLIDHVAEDADDLAAEGQALPADLQARADQVAPVIDAALGQLAGVEELARGLQETFGTTREELSEVLEAVAAVSGKAMSLGQRLLGPASDLGVDVPQALEARRQQLVAHVNAAVETLSADCSAPADASVKNLIDTVGQVSNAVRDALQTSHDDLDSRSRDVLSATAERSLGELHGVGGEVMELVSNIKATAHAVTDIVSSVGHTKDALMDGIKLTNGGVELIIGLLEELDQLLSNS